MDVWEEYVDPKFDKIIKNLQTSTVMDKLRARNQLNRQEYRYLLALATEEGRARILINDILPRKGPDSFGEFCKALLESKGQEHIVNVIIQPPEHLLIRGANSPAARHRPPAQRDNGMASFSIVLEFCVLKVVASI